MKFVFYWWKLCLTPFKLLSSVARLVSWVSFSYISRRVSYGCIWALTVYSLREFCDSHSSLASAISSLYVAATIPTFRAIFLFTQLRYLSVVGYDFRPSTAFVEQSSLIVSLKWGCQESSTVQQRSNSREAIERILSSGFRPAETHQMGLSELQRHL